MMKTRRQYQAPGTIVVVLGSNVPLLTVTSPVPVNPGEEGNQTGAEAPRWRYSQWEDDEEDYE